MKITWPLTFNWSVVFCLIISCVIKIYFLLFNLTLHFPMKFSLAQFDFYPSLSTRTIVILCFVLGGNHSAPQFLLKCRFYLIISLKCTFFHYLIAWKSTDPSLSDDVFDKEEHVGLLPFFTSPVYSNTCNSLFGVEWKSLDLSLLAGSIDFILERAI